MKLPGCRAFLVRLSDQTDNTLQRPIGRIEHVETGLRQGFHSYEELRDFVTEILADEVTFEDEVPGNLQDPGER